MTWRDDNHGIVTRSSEIKCFTDTHSWPMKLSQLNRQNGLVRAATYSLNAEYAKEIFQRRPFAIRILCNSKFRFEGQTLTNELPSIEVAHRGDMHAKFVLIAPDTSYLGSMNFVSNKMRETVVGLRGCDIHQHYAAWFDVMWQQSVRIGETFGTRRE
jgi:PLD-like domain